ncbi:hypothetical protein Tco_0793740 [Tanacetum coccineum]
MAYSSSLLSEVELSSSLDSFLAFKAIDLLGFKDFKIFLELLLLRTFWCIKGGPRVGDEAVHKELGDRVEKAAITDSSLEAEQDSDTILWVQKLKFDLRLHLNKSYDPPLSRVNTLGSGEDSMKLKELMEFCTKLSVKALDV